MSFYSSSNSISTIWSFPFQLIPSPFSFLLFPFPPHIVFIVTEDFEGKSPWRRLEAIFCFSLNAPSTLTPCIHSTSGTAKRVYLKESFHIKSYLNTSCHIKSDQIITYHIILWHITTRHIISCHIVSYHVVDWSIISYHVSQIILYRYRLFFDRIYFILFPRSASVVLSSSMICSFFVPLLYPLLFLLISRPAPFILPSLPFSCLNLLISWFLSNDLIFTQFSSKITKLLYC